MKNVHSYRPSLFNLQAKSPHLAIMCFQSWKSLAEATRKYKKTLADHLKISFFKFTVPKTTPTNVNSVIWCHLLKIFANSFDQDQDRQNVGPGQAPNRLTL